MATVSLEGYVAQLIGRVERDRSDLHRRKSMLVELRTLEFWRAIIAECLATFAYVFLVCGSQVSWPPHAASTLTKSLANGLSVATAAHCFGHVSGAHLNPAFTLAMLAVRRVTPLRAFLYVTAQCGGSIAGAALLYGTTGRVRECAGCTWVSDELSSWQAAGLELVLTSVVAFAMCAAADPNRRVLGSDALAVGIAYLACSLVALPATGASMNPARSLGPAFVCNTWTQHWVYWAGPLLGALLAALIYEYIFDSPNKKVSLPTKDREDSEREMDELKDDSDSKSSAALSSRSQTAATQQSNQQAYYRPLTPYEAHQRPPSRTTCTSAKYAAASCSQQGSYYSTMPKGGYRSWADAGATQFKF